jgi:hypothetical protein
MIAHGQNNLAINPAQFRTTNCGAAESTRVSQRHIERSIMSIERRVDDWIAADARVGLAPQQMILNGLQPSEPP